MLIRFRSLSASKSERSSRYADKLPQHIIKRSDKLDNESACNTLANENTFICLICFELKLPTGKTLVIDPCIEKEGKFSCGYDVDDLVSNTLGGIIGQYLFLSVAYVVTHPDWRKELKAYRRWKRNARTRTLYPFARRMGLARTALLATDEGTIWDFYVMKLGFRLVRQLVPLDSDSTDMLLEMGRFQVEVHCSNRTEALPQQTLTISARRLKPIIRRLRLNGVSVSGIGQDVYTGLRCVHLQGPDGVRITVIEK